jgi:hypothetical protein
VSGGVALPPVVAAALAVAACAAPYQPVTADQVRVASLRFPGSSRETLEKGRALTLSRCSRCHRPFEPGEFRADAWPALVSEMRKGAGLDDHEEALIVRYLVTASAATAKKPEVTGD